jgi:murein L,D-transpeptidase YafK
MKLRKIISIGVGAAVLGLATYYFYPYSKIPGGVTIDKIIVVKSAHKMFVYSRGALVHTYTIAIGREPVGVKQFEGDHRTPEGIYFINAKNPSSAFHKNLGISYPNAADIATARRLGKPSGGDIKIHGLRNDQAYFGRFQRWRDWTNGCIALTNEEVDDLYAHTPVGTEVVIQP